MKVRLVKGPFSGRVFEGDGRNDLIVNGPKKMTRKARYEWERDQYQNYAAYGPHTSTRARLPMVEARYKICMGMFNNGYTMVHAPLRHPDGSIFYEYVANSKREYQ